MYLESNIGYFIYYIFFCLCVSLLYPSFNYFFNYFKWYKNITPDHKKQYFISNLLKGLILGIFTPFSYYILYEHLINNNWNKNNIKIMGSLYSSLDLVSIFFVKKMQTTTLVHHIMVQVFYLVSLFYFDFSKETIGNPIVIYAVFSVFAFIVNIYLALRLVTNKFMKIIPTISSIIYQACCFLNWSYQLHWIYTSNVIIWVKIL